MLYDINFELKLVEVLQTTPIVTREWEELQPVQGKANVNPYRFYGIKIFNVF